MLLSSFCYTGISAEKAISELPFASVSKRVQVRNHSNENEFDLHENEHASETNFHMNGFAPRLVLRKRQKSTRKWPNARLQFRLVSNHPSLRTVA